VARLPLLKEQLRLTTSLSLVVLVEVIMVAVVLEVIVQEVLLI
tara:strand:+ start:253 stop:381 length:129 start_codon:yes stop_codon:yes gene_type:complete